MYQTFLQSVSKTFDSAPFPPYIGVVHDLRIKFASPSIVPQRTQVFEERLIW